MLSQRAFEPRFWREYQRGESADFREVFQEVHPGVFVGRILARSWCEDLLARVLDHEAKLEGQSPAPSNSMHEAAILTEALDLTAMMDTLALRYLSTVARQLYPDHVPAELSGQHSYVVRYGEDEDWDLGFHVDDSQVTLNLCLSVGEGAELVLEGVRCPVHVDTPSREGEVFEWTHQPGVSILHLGKNRHRVRPIRSGRRINLIVWGQEDSERGAWLRAFRAERCLPWCPKNRSLPG